MLTQVLVIFSVLSPEVLLIVNNLIGLSCDSKISKKSGKFVYMRKKKACLINCDLEFKLDLQHYFIYNVNVLIFSR